jgi:cell division cycle 14
MADRELADAVEVIPDRIFWAVVNVVPKATSKTCYFSIDCDKDFIYEPFALDFGPLNLAMVYKYCNLLEAKLAEHQDKHIVHCCSNEPAKRANSAFLICAYQVIRLGKSAELAYEPFEGIHPHFMPFRDASCGVCNFHLTISDCLKGLELSIERGLFDWDRFDVYSCEFFDKVENGDMNWIIPDKFLAFAGPGPACSDVDGFTAFTPEDYVPIFREANVGLVVRLNKKQYDRRRFIDNGIKHVDLYFLDGSCPSREIISKFLHITELEPGAVAVHCKAGLGRTGTLIGLYAMKHYQFPARAWIGWNRICRPGSILGPQQQFLLDMQSDMFQAGAALRRTFAPLAPGGSDAEHALAQQVERLTLRDRCQAEKSEDVGQGERLCNAKRTRSFNPLDGGALLPPMVAGKSDMPIAGQHGVPPQPVGRNGGGESRTETGRVPNLQRESFAGAGFRMQQQDVQRHL